MTRILSISDDLYNRLEAATQQRGLDSIERLLEEWPLENDDLHQRQETVRQIDALRERLFATYGEMPDSTDLIREDRAR